MLRSLIDTAGQRDHEQGGSESFMSEASVDLMRHDGNLAVHLRLHVHVDFQGAQEVKG